MSWGRKALGAITLLLGIEWIRLTFALVKLRALGNTEVMIQIMPLYYLVLIGILLGVGFLELSKEGL